ncbi:MAG: hypothetical protein RIT81_44840 [Deltaproteobacteria bacterium]
MSASDTPPLFTPLMIPLSIPKFRLGDVDKTVVSSDDRKVTEPEHD